jgi:23S rRNA (uracil1939-C5)-methyltransferase
MMHVPVTALGSQGDGIAPRGSARPLFIKNAVPGDIVELTDAGDIIRVIPGPNRQQPPCSHFGSCGGCQMQYVADDLYRDWISSRILSALAPLDIHPEEIAPAHISPAHTRRRVSVKLLRNADGMQLGYNIERSHRIVDLAQCSVMHPELWRNLQNLKVLAGPILTTGQAWMVQATLTDSGIDMTLHGLHQSLFKQMDKFVQLAEQLDLARLAVDGPVGLEVISYRRTPIVHFADFPVTLPPNSFLQATKDGELALQSAVSESLGTARKIADLFCGTGTFSLPLAQRASVFAADASKSAVEALARAAQEANLPVNILHQDLFRRPLRAEELNRFDAIVFDPPRAGAKEQCAEIARSNVKTVVAVSCNPNTFARDAEQLVKAGYRMQKLYPVGQFLWSTHVEFVARFVR